MSHTASLIISNGKFHTVDRENPTAQAVAIKDGKFLAVGSENDVMQHAGPETQIIDLHGHTAVPGLNDSHLHLIRGGFELQPGTTLGRCAFTGRRLTYA